MPFTQAGGLRIAYDAQGAGDAVVFLHGADDTRAAWTAALSDLGRDHLAAALDLRGHGESETPQALRQEDFALDINAVLDALQVPRAHLVGRGLGAVAAIEFARAFPARARSLILVDTPYSVEQLGAIAIPARSLSRSETFLQDLRACLAGLSGV